MSEIAMTPFTSLPGLETMGADDVGMCVDGVCAVPPTADDAASPASDDDVRP